MAEEVGDLPSHTKSADTLLYKNHIRQNYVHCTGWANKNRTFLNVDNFSMVSGRKACYMSKVC